MSNAKLRMNRSESVPAYQLTEADFQRHGAWQFDLDAEHTPGADESHVSPAAEAPGLGMHGSFLLAATFRLKNGHELPGAVQADFLGRKVHFTPAAIYAQGKSVDPLDSDTRTRLARITKAANANPIAWRLDAHLAGEPTVRRGRIARSRWVQAFVLLVQLISLRFARRAS